MGGIKNRDEKRKKAHVYSSGGGGGSKGPAVIDKRNQELPCPHCERTFKQAGRLQEHIKKQHTDASGSEAGPSAAEPPPATRAVAPAAQAPPAAAPPPRPSSSARATTTDTAASLHMMDVGCQGGYYSAKSPKLLLHELCLKEKVKPRYKATEAGPGLWKCKVVIPHPKNSDKDVVVFLDDDHAAPSQEEAAQRAAVAALNRVAGERALERVLPREYVPLWQALTQQRQQREERRRREADRQSAAAARQRAVSRRQAPAAVVMTEDKRQLVEQLISGLALEEPGTGAGSSGPGGEEAQESESAAALLDELALLGFSQGHARRAIMACSGSGAVSLPAALDWLCLNMPEDELPSNFAPGAAGKPVTIMHRGPSAASLATSSSTGILTDATADWDSSAASEPAVVELMQYGYPANKCAAALHEAGGDALAALGVLFRQLAGEPPAAASPASNGAAVDLAEWEEERTALAAIYVSDITFNSPSWTTLRLSVPLDTMLGGPESEVVLHLECWAPAEGGYPQQLPTLAARCSDVQSPALLSLTHQLALRATELRGHPMLFELASAAVDLLPLCVADHPALPPGWASGSGPASEGLGSALSSAADLAEGEAQQAKHMASSMQQEPAGSQASTQGRRRRHQSLSQSGTGLKPPRRRAPGIDLAAENRRLLEHQLALDKASAHGAMRAVRSRLPAAGQRQEVVGLIGTRRVVVISGATGCGKSTQVPQFVLEDAITRGEGGRCNIVCTQPRRISAVGLATRVAAERGEKCGEVVGYSVRLDSKQSARTRLLFCTTGILLRRLLSDPSLSGTTHVVLDEVHERSIESDLLLLLLRNLLESGANPGLRVVLMSATADADLFASYFSQRLGEPSGMVNIPGFTHPVKDYFLEDVLEATGFEVGKSSKWAKKQSGGGGGGGGKKSGAGADSAGSSSSLASYCEQTRMSLQNIEEAQVNYDLVEALVAHVVGVRQAEAAQQGAAAAILFFAPGAEEINRICRAVQGSPRVRSAVQGAQLWVLPLHGGLPPAQQARVFDRPPKGTLKVVVATNVAETSITIDDVTCVIDCGRVKEMRFDPDRGIARLQETWVSQASAQQRRGRAGRVQPGVCYRLLSQRTWGKLQRDTPPEVLRAPLQGLVLDVKGILGAEADVPAILAQMITPPAPAALQQALASLEQIGALEAAPSQALTPLGQHLTRMPCDPRIGKMLVYGALLRCLDPVLTVTAAHSHGRPAFFSPPDKREEADAAKRALVAHIAGSKSDHLAVVAAYNGWAAAVQHGGRSAGQDFCARHFVSDQAMEGIDAGRRQYAEILADLGFAPPGYGALRARERSAELDSLVAHEVDEYSGNARVVKSALVAGFYPQLLRIEHPPAKYQKVLGGAVEIEAEPQKLKFFDRHKGRVFLHPSSLNFTCGKFASSWAVYSEVVETSKVFVRESSMVPVYAVLLFGGAITVRHEAGLVQVDGWATFKAPARIAVLVRELRSQVAALLAAKIAEPGLNVSSSRVVEAMHHLLATDGF